MTGTEWAEMSVTYNYSEFFRLTLPEGGLRSLGKMKAAESIPLLEGAIMFLGAEQDEDYWKPTQGNAGHALAVMLMWAREHPETVWSVH